tara:strand:+ start:524 stop:2125 length:1602 start_codon:yes stop_codon:yes gene_type:complete
MALTTVDYNSYFNYALPTKQITFTDKTNFVSQGTLAANVTAVAKVTAPASGVIYNNTNHAAPDIDCGVSLDSIIVIPLPIDIATGFPEQGLYTIELEYVDSVVPATIVDTRTFTLEYSRPTVDISMTADCITPLLAAIDDSSYTSGIVDPTITRAFSIHYPPSLALADVTGTAGTLSTQTFYTVADQTVEHSSSLISDLSYLFDAGDSMYVIDQVKGSEVISVACDGDICDIYCCIRSQYLRWQDAKGTNATIAILELEKFVQITSIAEMVGEALRCNKSAHISDYVAQILLIANCDAGCSCTDGTPTLVTGLAVNGDTIIVAAGTGLTVLPTSGGGTTTYTVSLSSTNITKLANLRNTAIVDGSGITSTLVTTTIGGVTTNTYTITAIDTIVESMFVRVKIAFNASTVPTITIVDQKKYGTTFQAVNQTGGTEFVLNNNIGSFADWTNNFTSFTIGNFFSSAADYYPSIKLVNIIKPIAGTEVSWPNDFVIDITSMSANDFEVRFSDTAGGPTNGISSSRYTSIELIIKIQA